MTSEGQRGSTAGVTVLKVTDLLYLKLKSACHSATNLKVMWCVSRGFTVRLVMQGICTHLNRDLNQIISAWFPVQEHHSHVSILCHGSLSLWHSITSCTKLHQSTEKCDMEMVISLSACWTHDRDETQVTMASCITVSGYAGPSSSLGNHYCFSHDSISCFPSKAPTCDSD